MDSEEGVGQKSIKMVKKEAMVSALDLQSKSDDASKPVKAKVVHGTITRGKRKKAQLNNGTRKKLEQMSDSSNHDEAESDHEKSVEKMNEKKVNKKVKTDSEPELKKKSETIIKKANARSRKHKIANDNSNASDDIEEIEKNDAGKTDTTSKEELEYEIPRKSKRKSLPKKRTIKGKFENDSCDEEYEKNVEIVIEVEPSFDSIEESDDVENNSQKKIKQKTNRKGRPLCVRRPDGTEAVFNDDENDEISKSTNTKNTAKQKKNKKDEVQIFRCVDRYTTMDDIITRLSLTCDCCNLAYDSVQKLKEHIQEKFGVEMKNIKLDRIFECLYDGCGKKFSSTSNCKKHIESVHVQERKFTCEFCAFSFKRYTALASHLNALHSKEGDFNFECEVCGKRFRRRAGLDMHSTLHIDDNKNYVCSYEDCGKQFRLQTTLYKHEKCVHSGWKPYECDACGEKFTRKTYLQSHMYKHTGIKGYKCDICFKSFTQKGNLNQHIKALHGKKKKMYECLKCSQTFNFKSNLTKHLTKHSYQDYEILANYSDYEVSDFDQEDTDTDVKKIKVKSEDNSSKVNKVLNQGSKVGETVPLRNMNKHIYLSFDKNDKFLIMNPVNKLEKTQVAVKPVESPPTSTVVQVPVAFNANPTKVLSSVSSRNISTNSSKNSPSITTSARGNIQIYVVEDSTVDSPKSSTILPPGNVQELSTVVGNKTVITNVVGEGDVVNNLETDSDFTATINVTGNTTTSDSQNEMKVTRDIVPTVSLNEEPVIKEEVCITYVTTQPDETQPVGHDSSVTSHLDDKTVKAKDKNLTENTETVYVTDPSVIDALEVILGTGEQPLIPANVVSKSSSLLGETYSVSPAFSNENIIQGTMQLAQGIDSTVVDIINFTTPTAADITPTVVKSE